MKFVKYKFCATQLSINIIAWKNCIDKIFSPRVFIAPAVCNL